MYIAISIRVAPFAQFSPFVFMPCHVLAINMLNIVNYTDYGTTKNGFRENWNKEFFTACITKEIDQNIAVLFLEDAL